MSYKQFEANMLERKRVNPDGIFGFQCVDLAKQYLIDEFGLPNIAYGNAAQWWINTHAKILERFDKIPAGKGKIDVRDGDLVPLRPVDDQPRHKDGHLGIATGVQTDTTVEILEQNGSTGNGNGEGNNQIRKRSVPKHRVFGVLRPKTITPPPTSPKPETPQRTYVVVKGDNLTKIAKAHGLASWRPLYERNKAIIGANPDLIHPGQKLIIP